jgi:hypothetical protein
MGREWQPAERGRQALGDAMRLSVVWLVGTLIPTAILSQDFRAAISGRVTDPSGAALVAARVTVTNTSTAVASQTTTNGDGVYSLRYLIPGAYQIRVEASGFKVAVRSQVMLQVSDQMTMDISLELGGSSETVTVTGENPLIDTTAAVAGTVISNHELTQVMSITRIPFMLAGLSPGVILPDLNGTIPNAAGNGTASGFRVNGGVNNESNEFLLDGSPNTTGNQVAFIPSSDAVEEFRVASDAYDAQYGRQMGSTINVLTRSGTNHYHGELYEFHRDFSMGANTFQSNLAGQGSSVWHYNLWGGQLGGPIILPKVYNGRDKTFFFFNYEGMRDTEPRFATRSVPTADQRGGDYSSSFAVSNNHQAPLIIYDPLTTSTTAGLRQPFPGDKIPAARLSAISQKVLSFVPLPNTTGGAAVATGINDFVPHVPTVDTLDSAITRIDHQFNEKNRASASLRWNHWEESAANDFSDIATGSLSRRINRGISLDDVYAFGPSTVLDVRFSLTRFENSTVSSGNGYNPAELGFPASLVSQLPVIAFPSFSVGSGIGSTPLSITDTSVYSWIGAITRIHDKHTFNFGGQYMALQTAQFNSGSGAGSYSFSPGFTQSDYTHADGVTGSADASFLLGYPASASVTTNASGMFSQRYIGLYFQDNWRVSTRLTVNYGLRWDLEVPWVERYNRTNRGFDTTTPSPVNAAAQAAYALNPIPELPAANFQVLGGQLFAGAGGVPRSVYDSDFRAWQPRFGVAYRVTEHTAVRAGFGIFEGKTTALGTQNGFSVTTPYISTLDAGQTPAGSLTNPFPGGILAAPGGSQGLSTSLGQAPSWNDPTRGMPFSIQYSLHIERELPGRFVVDAGYVNNSSKGLAMNVPSNNIPLAAYLQLGQPRYGPTGQLLSQPFRLNDLVSNPFFGLPGFQGTAAGASQTIAVSSLLSPFPQFTSFNRTNVAAGTSDYRAFQGKVEKRFSESLALLSAYTWSKQLDNISYLNPIAYQVEHVLDSNDRPHHFSLASVYQMPVGRGKRFLPQIGRLSNALIGGWQVSGNYNVQSGAPIVFTTNLTWNGQDASIPRVQRTLNEWFNTADFGIIPKAQTYALRTTPTTFAHIRASRNNNLDCAIFKVFQTTEWMQMQFRVESFNALNHPRFGVPITDPTSSAFGTVTQAQLNQPRILQLALKINF